MKLRLKGAKGIKAGPLLDWTGPDEITIDFTGREGIAALEGINGCGKTTCMESLSHFPQLISRNGALWIHFGLRDSEKEFEDDYMGHHYRSLVKIDAQSHKMEGYLYIDGSEASCCNEKISAYTAKLEEIFGKPEAYFRSRFSPQRSKKTSEKSIDNMKPGDFRDLLRDFLGLQRYEAWSKTSKSASDIITGQAAAVDTKIDRLNMGIAGKKDLDTKYLSAGARAEFLRDDKTILQNDLAQKRAEVDRLKEVINKNALALQKRADLQGQIDRLQAEMEREKATAKSEIDALAVKWRETNAAVKGLEDILKNRAEIEAAAEKVKVLEGEIEALQKALDELAQELPGQQEAVNGAEVWITGLKQAVKNLENDPERQALRQKVSDIAASIKTEEAERKALERDPELMRLKADLKSLEQAAQVGDGIDASCASLTCAAIKSVNEAKEKIPGAREAAAKRLAEVTDLMEAVARKLNDLDVEQRKAVQAVAYRDGALFSEKTRLETEISASTHTLRNLQQVVISNQDIIALKRQAVAKKRAELEKAKVLAVELSEIRVAESRKTDLEKQLAEVTEQGTAKKKAWDEKEHDLGGRIFTQNSLLRAITIDETSEVSLLLAQGVITEIETVKIPEIDGKIQLALENAASIKATLERMAEHELELTAARAERDALHAKIAQWRYLQIACGEKGLQALEVSGAAPAIVKYANDLLMSAFDIPYTMRLKTFDEETQTECFKVLIICPDGQEIDLDLISGGQRAWCVQALWLAMSLLKQHNSGTEFDYFCADESDGALDQENAARYAALYPAFMKIAKLKSLYFISHQPPARALADHVLQFEAGKNPAWR